MSNEPLLTPEQLAVIQLVVDERVKASSLATKNVELPSLPYYQQLPHPQHYQQIPGSQQPIYLAVNVNNDVKAEPKHYQYEQREEKRLEQTTSQDFNPTGIVFIAVVIMLGIAVSGHR